LPSVADPGRRGDCLVRLTLKDLVAVNRSESGLDPARASFGLTTGDLLKNPFVIYVLSFGAVLAVYQLGWSEVYPALSSDLLIFFALTFLVASLLAKQVAGAIRATKEYQPGQLPKYTALLLLVCFVADIVYTGGIPLIMVMNRQFDYAGQSLGVPHLHVFIVTASSAFCTIRFADFLYSKRLRYLAEALLPLVYFFLIFYRGPILICLVSWAFVFFIQRDGLGMLRGCVVAALFLVIMHFFGVFGNLREGRGAIESLGHPTAAFENAPVPRTYFWTYIYLTSPMANLQLAVNTLTPRKEKVAEFVVSEMLPDALSKRILPWLGAEQIKPPQVSVGLSVASLYGRSYVYQGWLGTSLLFGWLAALSLLYLRLIRDSPYRVPCLALLNTLIVFCTFQNMIAFAGLVLQLVWPLLLGGWPFFRRK
jgi:hypothetical protein